VSKAPVHLAGAVKPSEQAHILYGTRSLAADDDDRFASSILNTVLGGPMSSRLFQEVREKRGLVYAIYATTNHYIGTGQFNIYAGTRPDNAQEVLELISKEISALKTTGITADELSWSKDYVCGHVALSLESTSSRMIKLGKNAVNGLELLSLDETLARYRAVSLDDVARVIKRVLSEAPVIAVISPQGPDQFSEFVSSL
jgi:predicted Zn-dependent peptidase